MRILIALTYYRPHVSGVSVYAERLARGLTRRGHRVTVLTSRFSRALPADETIDGVRVVRMPVLTKLSKGVVMPFVPFHAIRWILRHDVVNVHMPQFEASLYAVLGRLLRRRVVLTYHCDLELPPGAFNRLVQGSLEPLNAVAATAAQAIVINTADYGESSPFLSRYADRLAPIVPPIEIGEADPHRCADFAGRYHIPDGPCIGFAARFAAEKGVEHLLAALPIVRESIPDAHIVFSGACHDTVGEAPYAERLRPLLEPHRAHLTFLPLLPVEELPCFFAGCDVLAVTSVNSTESFGLVQAEAMLCGTPVVATDLPGIREAVRRTGMGRIVPAGAPEALAAALIEVIRSRSRYVCPRSKVEEAFGLERTLDGYETILGADAGRA